MSDSFYFWTHGVNVVPQDTIEFTGRDNELVLIRDFTGAEIHQRGGTESWFHFPIPSPSKLDDDTVEIRHAWLRVMVGNGAIITKVKIYHSVGPGNEKKKIYDTEEGYNETGINEQLEFDINPNRHSRGPIVMSVRVKFEEKADYKDRQIVFAAAGASFEED